MVKPLALLLLTLGSTALSASHLCADVLLLKDGRILENVKLSRAEGFVIVKFQHGEVRVPEALVLELISDDPAAHAMPTDDPDAASKQEKGLVPFEGKWMKPEERSALVAKRVEVAKKRVAERKEKQLWRNRLIEKTKSFEFESTVPPEIFPRYRDLMETYFTDFAKRWGTKKPSNSRLKVCFYGNRGSFERTGGAGPGVLGYFRYVAPMELNVFYDRFDPLGTEFVIFHEANHYLQKLIDVKFDMPHFPGEALAEYYGASRYDEKRKKLETGLIQEGRLVEVRTEMDGGRKLGLAELIGTDELYEHYTWGWSLVYFLMNEKGMDTKFQKFVVGLAKDKGVTRVPASPGATTVEAPEVLKAFRRYLDVEKDEDFAAMETRWHAFVEGLKLDSARGLEAAAFGAANTYPPRPIKARRLFSEAVAAGSKNAAAYHRYAGLLADNEEYDQAFKMWEKAIELDPLEAGFYAGMAQAHQRRGNREQAERLAQLAREIDPDATSWGWDLDELLGEGEGR